MAPIGGVLHSDSLAARQDPAQMVQQRCAPGVADSPELKMREAAQVYVMRQEEGVTLHWYEEEGGTSDH